MVKKLAISFGVVLGVFLLVMSRWMSLAMILTIPIYTAVLFWVAYLWITPFLDIAAAIRPFIAGKTDILPLFKMKGKKEARELILAFQLAAEKLKEKTEGLLEERNEKELLVEALMEGVIVIDSGGVVRYVNHTAAQMVSTGRRHMIGKPLTLPDAHPKAEIFKKCQSIVKIAAEQGSLVTDACSFGEGQKVHLDLIAVPKLHKKGTILILQDKSSQYKVVEMGKDFIANASHELRTPITIIKGFAETLQDLPAVSKPMLKEITEKIVRNCHRMDTLVRNLLTLADIEYVPEHRFQECDIVALADNCCHLLLTLVPDVKIDIEKTADRIMADADPDLLELALMNLLENGVKYSQSPAHLTIFVKKQGEEVVVAIQDRGIGIPKDDLPHVFERFYTVDKAHSRRLGGAGLGLSIVRTIIEKHEGTISVASVIGQGTTFTLLLPQHRQAHLVASR